MPLFIHRIATVVSLTQLEEEAAVGDIKSCQQNQDGNALVSSVAGRRLPKYCFAVNPQLSRSDSDELPPTVPDVDNSSHNSTATGPQALKDDSDSLVPVDSKIESREVALQKSVLDTVLLALWEDCAEQGLFRYDVTACPTKVVPGLYGFIAQLNEGRATKKRPTEFCVDKVCQTFDDTKFNFTKAYMKEVLVQFEPSSRTDASEAHIEECAPANDSPNLVFINVSPIEYGHVLLVPRVLDRIPQLADHNSLKLALHFAREADNPYFRLGYNSLGAYATINHLHFQGYYLAAPFPCERAPTVPLLITCGAKRRRGNVVVSRLTNYPVNGLVFEEGDSLDDLASTVASACIKLQEANVPHNLLITDCGSRVFLWPQCYAEKQALGQVSEELLETGVNPAAFEIAGHLVLKRKSDYDGMTQQFAWKMLAEVSLPELRFLEVVKRIL